MIDKKDLKGKYITYIDKDSKTRTEKVIKVYSSYVTVRTVKTIKTLHRFPKTRVHKNKILGRQHRKSGREEIKW